MRGAAHRVVFFGRIISGEVVCCGTGGGGKGSEAGFVNDANLDADRREFARREK